MGPSRSDDADSAITRQYAQLLSLAAHEFRTPASVVGGYLRMLQRDTESPLGDRQRKMVDEAAKSCARLVALIGELSEIGKLDSNQAAVHEEPLDLFTALPEVASGVHEGKDREVRLQLSGMEAGARLTGDGVRLRAAFGAFLHAILREQPSAGVVVVDRRIVRDATGASAVVTIARDTDVQRAYESTRVAFDEKRGGVGLTLPIARRVVERHGGHVWSLVSSDPDDRGLKSAVVVSIPLPEQP
jgi:signal transduction histidine kinase